MKTPYELAYRYVIPHLAKEAVLALKRRGLSNTDVAKALGITPSAVTRYIKGERGSSIDLMQYPEIKEAIEELADNVVKGVNDVYAVWSSISELTAYALSRRYLCTHHSKIDPEIDPARCRICPETFGHTNISKKSM